MSNSTTLSKPQACERIHMMWQKFRKGNASSTPILIKTTKQQRTGWWSPKLCFFILFLKPMHHVHTGLVRQTGLARQLKLLEGHLRPGQWRIKSLKEG
eukprot:3372087-Ditylum_brightwellii.AAC.2